MIITETAVELSSSREYIEEYSRRESLTYWQDEHGSRTVTENGSSEGRELSHSLEQRSLSIRISAEGRAMQAQQAGTAENRKGEKAVSAEEVKLSALILLVEHLTGRKIKLIRPEDLEPLEKMPAEPREPAPIDREGWGLVYDYEETRYESEKTAFSAEGVVRTADGREIDFSVELAMSREFMEREEIHLRAGDALKDPLVINFQGTAAQLSETSFSFDLDIDGNEEQISFVGPGSGFLALDRNGDGTINDGGELFGPATGEGFEELARYDQDKNDWLDENDSVYSRLRIWTRDESGNDRLFALGQKGIGAIYLGSAETPFALKNSENALLGQVRSSGVFLRENGTAGTIQQLDLVV